ncbi:RNA polymerase III subunit RPC82-domain-containing protein [Auriculariales sp. MPI-PUGE-AT-0066]|nr:RNA polymerase III subunit RPC82-domain-containing protein [Auriculariales sp. MPI-PUGE-AT-0066]
MADKENGKLCIEIIYEHFGPLTARIATALLQKGRMSMAMLAREIKMKPQTLRASVLVLIQHNILWHAAQDGAEILEINTEECLSRLLFGNFCYLAKQSMGQQAADIVQTVLDHGKLRVQDILSRMHVNKSKDVAQHTSVIHRLISSSHLKPSTVLSHICPRDKLINYEEEEKKKKNNAIASAKDIKEAKELAIQRLKQEELDAEKIGMKRKATDALNGRPTKKQAVEDSDIDDEVYWRVNYAKFHVHLRNNLLVAAAADRFNNAAGEVLKATLSVAEPKTNNVSDVRSDALPIINVVNSIPANVNIFSGLATSASKSSSTTTLVKEFVGILSAADNPTPAGIAGAFLSTSATVGKVQVEYDTIHRRLRRRVLEGVVRERFGEDSVRLVRILMDTGKMDDKHLAKIGMKAQKDIRTTLAAMNAAGIVAMQEVPKGSDRAPMRTYYLWYVNLAKTNAVIVRDMYKTLYNVQHRKRSEGEDHIIIRSVLEKMERGGTFSTDDSQLTRTERELLAELHDKRRRLTVLQMRIMQSVFVLKNLGGVDME